ncbi:MAG: DUF2868 domain-containing protein [Campylobacterota bacterium]|nr:DUF2868 domain-containing protein [Campylobacterota bacterium]
MNLKTYVEFYELLERNKVSREENRTFGLATEAISFSPFKQIVQWVEQYKSRLEQPSLSEKFSSYLYGITFTLVIGSFFLGLFSGVGLLSYSGHEPVNVIYFIAMVVLLPLTTMTFTLITMFKTHSTQPFLVHLSPAFWMEKLLQFLPRKLEVSVENFKVNPLLAQWLIIKRSQLLALVFSLGLLLALLGMVVTKDIAFAWSTTLQVSPQEFHSLVYSLAFAWRELFPWAVPSVELIEQSQYFRLGEKLNVQMVDNASKLGEWWKFLAFATLFYALLLRFMVWLLSLWGFRYALLKSFLSLEGSAKLLREMNEPIITTTPKQLNSIPTESHIQTSQSEDVLSSSYSKTLGWSLTLEELHLLNDSMGVESTEVFEVGGNNSLEQDTQVASHAKGEVLFYVKSWEPPTMDFVDFIEELTEVTSRVTLVPVGTVEEQYLAKPHEIEMWGKKLQLMGNRKVWLKR